MSSKLKLAITLALSTAVISGTSVFATKLALNVVKDPIVFTFLKNAVVSVFLIGLLIMSSKLQEIKSLKKKDIVKLSAIGVIGGSLPFILFFTGLTMIPAITAAFIHKTLFIWVALLAIPILKERIGLVQFAALGLLLGGNLVLFGIPKLTLGTGEILVISATLLWAVENIIAKIALKNISSPVVASARMVFGSLIILVVIIVQGKISLLTNLNASQWGWTLLTGTLLTGYVLTWYTALKHAPATLVASLLVPATLITNALSAIFLTHALPSKQLLSGTLLALGIVLLISRAHKIASKNTPIKTSIQSAN